MCSKNSCVVLKIKNYNEREQVRRKSYLDGRRSDDVISVSEYGGVVAINNYHITLSIFIFKQQNTFGQLNKSRIFTFNKIKCT